MEPFYDSEDEVLGKNVSGGLLELPHDDRDLTLGGIFSRPDLSKLAESFWYSPQRIKNQGDSDLCTGFATTTVSELQEDVELSPEYQFARTRQIAQAPVEAFGANLRDACASAVKFGSQQSSKFPWTLEGNGRDFFAEYKNIPAYVDDFAYEHRKKTYMAPTDLSGVDLFDDIRSAIYTNRLEECAIVTGALWRPEWLSAKDGMLPPEYDQHGTPHAFVILGYQWKPSLTSSKYEHFLVLQLSSGTEVGNGGLFYMDRTTANKELKYGNFLFKDMPLGYAKFLRDTGQKYKPGLFGRIGQLFKGIVQ